MTEKQNSTKKQILYFDMDGVLVDFQSGLDKMPDEVKKRYADDGTGKPHYDDIPRLFAQMAPMPGAIEAVEKLAKVFDVYILSTAPWNNPSSWSDKLKWVKKYFPETFYKRLILSHHKDLLQGDFLIDDRDRHGTKTFMGEWIQFGTDKFPNWPTITEYLLNK